MSLTHSYQHHQQEYTQEVINKYQPRPTLITIVIECENLAHIQTLGSWNDENIMCIHTQSCTLIHTLSFIE